VSERPSSKSVNAGTKNLAWSMSTQWLEPWSQSLWWSGVSPFL
jgi:hypothetical protein